VSNFHNGVDIEAVQRGALEPVMRAMGEQLNLLASVCHKQNEKWWHNPATGERLDRNRPEMIALMHSELSECLEGERKNLMDDHLPHRPQAEVELADAIIRILDYAAGFGYDIGGAFVEKTIYNATRADHTNASRLSANGKKF
jgi:hypothetical protein